MPRTAHKVCELRLVHCSKGLPLALPYGKPKKSSQYNPNPRTDPQRGLILIVHFSRVLFPNYRTTRPRRATLYTIAHTLCTIAQKWLLLASYERMLNCRKLRLHANAPISNVLFGVLRELHGKRNS
jgi:hypothetical protein